jgi:hypothetical protein
LGPCATLGRGLTSRQGVARGPKVGKAGTLTFPSPRPSPIRWERENHSPRKQRSKRLGFSNVPPILTLPKGEGWAGRRARKGHNVRTSASLAPPSPIGWERAGVRAANPFTQ